MKRVDGLSRGVQSYNTNPAVKIGNCDDCDKVIYLSRKTARVAARRYVEDSRPRAYRCPADDRWWHIGHIPDYVRQGLVSRAEWDERRKPAKP